MPGETGLCRRCPEGRACRGPRVWGAAVSRGEAPESQKGVGFTTNLQWSGVTSPCVLRPWSKRNQENYLMRSCRGREWGHGVRSLGGAGGEAWRSEQRKEEHGWEVSRIGGERGVKGAGGRS